MAYDLAVIGGGPGGYVAAIRAAQLGMQAACIERDATLGGTCLNVGCIPSKALLDSSEFYHRLRHATAAHGIKTGKISLDLAQMMRRKDEVVAGLTKGIEYLFRKHSVTWVRGTARLVGPTRIEVLGPDGTQQTVEAARIVLATGSAPISFPGAPFDEERVLSSTGALALSKVPEHLIVIGGGVIGLELGSVWLRLGARVTVLEVAPTILPGMDTEIVKAAEGLFREQGFDLRTGVHVKTIERDKNGVQVTLEGGTVALPGGGAGCQPARAARTGGAGRVPSHARHRSDREGTRPATGPSGGMGGPASGRAGGEVITGDRCLVAIGRRPYTEGLGLDELGIRRDMRGAILVDDRYHTGVGEIYAIGDAIGGDLLAHKAMAEGIAAAEWAAGRVGQVNYAAIAAVVYTDPEIAAVGLTEAQVREEGRAVRVGKFPFAASGRARAAGETHGLVKVVADAEGGRLLGLHILGPRASELIAEAGLAIEFEASAEDVAIAAHAHPTLSEALKEAALAAIGRAIHV